MFHAWGFAQLAFAASMACTIVTRRKFDPEATLALVDEHRATGLCVVPVMFDRIMDLPDDVRARYSGRSLRFAAASGSRMRPDVVIKFMDQFGDVIYNNYNATEAGMIATATPADLRAAPDTAGRPAEGTDIRILDGDFREQPDRRGRHHLRPQLHPVRRLHLGATKDFHDGLHVLGRRRLPRRRGPAVRGRPRRRDDRLRRRERLPDRGGEDARRAPRRGRGRGARRRRRRSTASGWRRSSCWPTAPPPRRTRSRRTSARTWRTTRCRRTITVLDESAARQHWQDPSS